MTDNATDAWLATLEEADREMAEEALSRSSCPYRAGGTCDQGCYSEPACITDEPVEGWAGLLASLGFRAQRGRDDER